MDHTPFAISHMLNTPGIRGQIRLATEALAPILSPENGLGRAYQVCTTWQRRFELALRSEIPDWPGLAAFRYMLDFTPPPEVINTLQQTAAAAETAADCPRWLNTFAQCQHAYHQYLVEKRDLYAGKFLVTDAAAEWLLAQLPRCQPVLGGQAGNILWLWQSIGAQGYAFTPYCSQRLAGDTLAQPPMAAGRLLWLQGGEARIARLAETPALAGLGGRNDHSGDAPTAVSLTLVREGRRLIFILPGFRLLDPQASRGYQTVQYFFRGQPLSTTPLSSPDSPHTWPSIPLFGECSLTATGELEIHLTDPDHLAAAITGQVDYAVIGGIDAIFYDDWLRADPPLQARLLQLLEKQLRAMAECGVRIGVELSGLPRREYALFIQRLCRDDVIVALGINGVDELPLITGQHSLDLQLYDWWLDPQSAPVELRAEARQLDERGPHFEYLTYLRARRLAQATGVRTLYVHTMTLDFVLRRDADPGALLRAQLGDLMGKGLVIAALLQRNYGPDWRKALPRMTPAINPQAMARLGHFAQHFCTFESMPAAHERLLSHGYWLAPTHGDYALAVVPVVWPHVSDEAAGATLPQDMNPTGAGDMTFGAFLLLGGI